MDEYDGVRVPVPSTVTFFVAVPDCVAVVIVPDGVCVRALTLLETLAVAVKLRVAVADGGADSVSLGLFWEGVAEGERVVRVCVGLNVGVSVAGLTVEPEAEGTLGVRVLVRAGVTTRELLAVEVQVRRGEREREREVDRVAVPVGVMTWDAVPESERDWEAVAEPVAVLERTPDKLWDVVREGDPVRVRGTVTGFEAVAVAVAVATALPEEDVVRESVRVGVAEVLPAAQKRDV